jgi:hypothetical protein
MADERARAYSEDVGGFPVRLVESDVIFICGEEDELRFEQADEGVAGVDGRAV